MQNTKLLSLFIIIFFSIFSLACSDVIDKSNKNERNSDNKEIRENYALNSSDANPKNAELLTQRNDEISNSRHNALTRAIAKATPAIVGINVTEVRQVVYRNPFDVYDSHPLFRRFFGDQIRPRVREYEVKGLGSGFIITPDGYILTNHHVAGNASKVIVTMTDGVQYDAQIIGSDAVSDVALLKIDGNNLPYLKMSDSDDLIIGEWAIALGNPFGLFDKNSRPTVTVGVVSNIGINMYHQEQGDYRIYKNMIQTDAAISSGNSGGPLINANGEVIGMNTIIFSTANSRQGAGSIGIGFSIPINRVRNIFNMLLNEKKLDRNFYTGIEPRDLNDEISSYLNLEKRLRGVVVFGITRRSSADEAGIEPGDIIIEIDGNKIYSTEDFYVNVLDGTTGQKLKLTLQRDGKLINKVLELKPKPGR